jgi:hypothetical protein
MYNGKGLLEASDATFDRTPPVSAKVGSGERPTHSPDPDCVALAVQYLLGRAALADHSSEASQRVTEQLPVRVDERRSAVAACHELLSLLDSIREMRRRDIELAHTGMQPLERIGVVGW